MSNLNVQVSEIQSFVDELSASKSLLETQMSELELQRDQAQQKLSELESSSIKLNSDLEVINYFHHFTIMVHKIAYWYHNPRAQKTKFENFSCDIPYIKFQLH